jgi:hypothetical protein
MSYMQRRLIHTVRFFNNTYESQKTVQRYVEHSLKVHCASSGLDAQGAETAIVKWASIPSPFLSRPPTSFFCSGGAHTGGLIPSEIFHLTFKVTKGDGVYIVTTNPYTGKKTDSHHFYIASDPMDLVSEAKKWVSGQK